MFEENRRLAAKADSGFPLPRRVTVTDVVARDGFQNEDLIIPTAAKIEVIKGLVKAGVTSIEATSFVHPSVIPQLADASQTLAGLPAYPGVTYSALIPNSKGAQRALAAGVKELHLVLSASESHNRANLNRSTRESLEQLRQVVAYVKAENPSVQLIASIATAFHCPFEGRTTLDRLVWVAEELIALGLDSINLADTDGAVNPLQVWQSVTALKARFPQVSYSLHLHNTRDMGLANVIAGLQAGITQFDAALGGLGGCPFAPGASGNLATEDLVHLLHEMGVETGIDLDLLITEGKKLRPLVGHYIPSFVSKAGPAYALRSFEGVKVAAARPPVTF
ncbi:MAG TPA: hydroxymethylglutaryl-CoA lyase [Chloroflexia bacterium]|nr:hydroxymethylglutaryl-CoA lyase [Chloroflexia bacterium]